MKKYTSGSITTLLWETASRGLVGLGTVGGRGGGGRECRQRWRLLSGLGCGALGEDQCPKGAGHAAHALEGEPGGEVHLPVPTPHVITSVINYTPDHAPYE